MSLLSDLLTRLFDKPERDNSEVAIRITSDALRRNDEAVRELEILLGDLGPVAGLAEILRD